MNYLQKDEFNAAIESGKDLLLFCYRENEAESTLSMSTALEIDGMIGREFDFYFINVTHEIEISDALNVTTTPIYISIKNKKVFRRKAGILHTTQVLDLIR